MNKREYATVCALLGALWPQHKWSVETIKAGERILLDLPADDVLAAVEMLAAEGERFAPNPGQVRKTAVEMATIAAGSDMPDADEALGEVYEAIARVGHYGTPEWSHEAIGATVDALGGWQEAVCHHENTEAFRAHFLKLYASAVTRRRRQQVAPESVRQLIATGLDLRLGRGDEDPPTGLSLVEGTPE